MQQVVWDVFFKYPFWGSYIAIYIPFKALAAGTLLFLSYLLWAKALDQRVRTIGSVLIFIGTVVYFGLAYADLTTFEYAVFHGKSELLMRAAQVFVTPHFTSFIAIGAWTSIILTIISILLILEVIISKLASQQAASPLAKLNNGLVMVLGPPVAVVAAIYTAMLFNEATARGILVDPILVPLHFSYALAIGAGVVYVVGRLGPMGRLSSYSMAASLGIAIIQLILFGLGLYRADAQVAWTIMISGVNPLIEGMNYGVVSSLFWAGFALWVISVAVGAVGVKKQLAAVFAISLILFAAGISMIEFARLMAAQFVPNS